MNSIPTSAEWIDEPELKRNNKTRLRIDVLVPEAVFITPLIDSLNVVFGHSGNPAPCLDNFRRCSIALTKVAVEKLFFDCDSTFEQGSEMSTPRSAIAYNAPNRDVLSEQGRAHATSRVFQQHRRFAQYSRESPGADARISFN